MTALLRGAFVAVTLLLGACHSSDDDDRSPPDDGTTTPPTAPLELSGVYYPGTGVELVWSAASDDVAVTGYDVVRDGTTLASALDATTYLDMSAATANDYDYEVRAVDEEGTRGPAALVRVSTPDAEPILSSSNWFIAVGEVLDVFTGRVYDRRLVEGPEFDSAGSIHRYDFDYENTPFAFYEEHACPGGGTRTVRGTQEFCDGRCYSTISMYYACEIGDDVLLGRRDFSSGYSSSTETFDELTLTPTDGAPISIDGTLGFVRLGSKISNDIRRSAELSRYEAPVPDGTVRLDDVEIVFGYGRDAGAGTASAELDGSLTLRSPLSGGRELTITTPTSFIDTESDTRHFPVGTLRIEAEDGSLIELEADNGDTASFDVTLSAPGGTPERFAEPWDEWLERLGFDR